MKEIIIKKMYKTALARQRRNKRIYKKFIRFFASKKFEKALFRFVPTAFVILGILILNIPITNAYFSDFETSTGNVFVSGTLNFHLNPATDFAPLSLNKGEATSTSVTLVDDGTIGFQYIASTTVTGGDSDLCNYLNLQASLNGVSVYNGAVPGFITLAQNYVDPSAWNFIVTLPSGATDSLQDKTCNFKIDFKGWQKDLLITQGFSDVEQLNFAISSGHWTASPSVPAIVLNEFLPNPDGFEYGFDFGNNSSNMPKGEWVELYNNSDSDIDLTGWYLRDNTPGDGNKTPINFSHVLSGSLIIPSHQWLVVYMNKAIYNNTGDTVKLYDSNNILVDSYSFGDNSGFCDMEPTPGSENDTIPSGSCSNVPDNKSYARIPDGTGSWVDPIPTPGQANILEEVLTLSLSQGGGGSEVVATAQMVGNEPLVTENATTTPEMATTASEISTTTEIIISETASSTNEIVQEIVEETEAVTEIIIEPVVQTEVTTEPEPMAEPEPLPEVVANPTETEPIIPTE